MGRRLGFVLVTFSSILKVNLVSLLMESLKFLNCGSGIVKKKHARVTLARIIHTLSIKDVFNKSRVKDPVSLGFMFIYQLPISDKGGG